MILGMLKKMDMSLVRASFDLGASSGYTLWRIVVPLLRPILLSCYLLSFIRSIADFGTPVVIGGRFETVSTEIYMQVIGYSRLDKSAALNVLLLVPTIIVFVLYRYLMKKNEKVIDGNSNKTIEAGILSDYEVCRQLLYGWEQVSFCYDGAGIWIYFLE